MAQIATETTTPGSDTIHSTAEVEQEVSSSSLDVSVEELELDSQSGRNEAEDESRYPTGAKLNLILLSIGLVLILSGMDASIVAIAVPAMTDHWHTVKDVGWYSAAYRLCMCSFQFMFGKLYKLFSVKRVFMSSVAIFLIGSALCAGAPSSLSFIVGRAISGFAASGIIAGCFTLIVQTLPLRKRPLYTSIAAAVEGMSVIAAPLLGGILVQINWRWCFIINVPLGITVLGMLAYFLQDVHPVEATSWRQKLQQLDLIGNLVLVPSLTCLFMALSWAGVQYPWNSPTIIALLCVFIVLLIAFGIDQWLKQDSATLPPRILKNRNIISGFIFSLCCNSAINIVEYYLPTWLQAVKEYSPSKSGYLMLPGILGGLIANLMHGAGVSALGYYVPFMLAGSVLMPVFSGLMTTLTIETGVGKLIAYFGLLGFAVGIGFQAPQVAVQASLSQEDASIGLAIIIFAQNFGPAVFVSGAQSIFTNRLSANLNDLNGGLNATTIDNMGLSDIKSNIGKKRLHDVLLGLDKSLIQTWYLAVALTCVTMIGSASMEWKSVKQKRN